MILKTELLSYQRTGVEKLKKLKIGALFMEMGTGKTRTALELIKLRLEKNKVDAVLWLHPCSIASDILHNIRQHSDLAETDVLHMCGIETLSTSVKENLRLLELVENNRVYLIVDESSLVKNPYAMRSKYVVRLSERCKYKLILNGTPVTRNEADLYNQFYLLDWRILEYRSYWSFEENHVVYDKNNPKRIMAIKNTEYLAKRIEPFTYECKKDDVLNLPSISYKDVGFYMTDWQEENYEYVIAELIEQIDEFRPETIYQFFAALQAVISGFAVSVKYSKGGAPYTETKYIFENPLDNPRIEALRNQLYKAEKYIIFCNYLKEIDVITAMLNIESPGSAVAFYGNMNQRLRNESLNVFAGPAQYFVAHKRCGAFGLNLQFCSNIIYVSHDWDWGTREQSESRVHRIGQKKEVSITDIVCWDSIDVKILDCLRKKRDLADSFKKELKKMQDLRSFVRGK